MEEAGNQPVFLSRTPNPAQVKQVNNLVYRLPNKEKPGTLRNQNHGTINRFEDESELPYGWSKLALEVASPSCEWTKKRSLISLFLKF